VAHRCDASSSPRQRLEAQQLLAVGDDDFDAADALDTALGERKRALAALNADLRLLSTSIPAAELLADESFQARLRAVVLLQDMLRSAKCDATTMMLAPLFICAPPSEAARPRLAFNSLCCVYSFAMRAERKLMGGRPRGRTRPPLSKSRRYVANSFQALSCSPDRILLV
jgi:hypothetical protein